MGKKVYKKCIIILKMGKKFKISEIFVYMCNIVKSRRVYFDGLWVCFKKCYCVVFSPGGYR